MKPEAGSTQKRKIISICLIISIVFGILYMVILPFPASPDENRHFLKIYSITEGYILPSDETILPDGLDIPDQYDLKYKEISSHYGDTADYNNMKEYDLSRTAFYFPLVYAPQITGFMAAKAFTHKIYSIALIGRIFGYIFNVCMVCAAVSIIPYGEMIIFLSVLNPMYLQQAVSLSGDSVVNTLAVFLTAYILALRARRVKAIWPLFVIFPILAVCKMFYLPMVFLVFLIPKDVYKKRKSALLTRILLIAETLMCSAVWIYAVSRTTLYIADEKTGSNLQYISSDPAGYCVIIFKSILYHGRTWLRQTFGGNLGWISVNVFMPFILIYLLIFIYTALSENGDMKLKDRICILIIDLIIFIVVLTTEYVQWTSYKAPVIDGVQGRYFLPLIPVTFFMVTGRGRFKLPKKNLNYLIYGYMIFYNMVALVTVYRMFSWSKK